MRTRTPIVVTGFPACAKAITPSDITPLLDYDNQPRAMTVYVGSAGTVSVLPVGNSAGQFVTFTMVAGGVVPVEATMVRFTGTSASNLVGLF
jgi:hypothetical protein